MVNTDKASQSSNIVRISVFQPHSEVRIIQGTYSVGRIQPAFWKKRAFRHMEVNGAMPFGLGPVAEQSRAQAQRDFVYCSRHDLTMLIFQLTGSFEVKKKKKSRRILPLKTFYEIFCNVTL